MSTASNATVDGGPATTGSRPHTVGRLPRRRARSRGPARRRRLGAYLYLLPAAGMLALFIVYPLVRAVQYSFLSWDGVGTAVFNGVANWTRLVRDPLERSSLVHIAILFGFYAFVPMALALVAVGALARRRWRGMAAFRGIVFLPQVLVTVVTAIVWTWLLAPQGSGSLNSIAHVLGLGPASGRPWLGQFGTALVAVGAIAVWIQFGLCFVLFLAGIQRISPTLYEAIRVDGAGPVGEFFRITVPLLRREIGAVITISAVSALGNFSLIYVATGGGPGTSTMVPGLLVYRDAFQLGDVGDASALGIAIAVLLFVITLGIRWLLDRRAV